MLHYAPAVYRRLRAAARVPQACRVADRIGVGVYFNTLVPLGDQVCHPPSSSTDCCW